MTKKINSRIERLLLWLSLPIAVGCSATNNFVEDDIYYFPKEKNNITTRDSSLGKEVKKSAFEKNKSTFIFYNDFRNLDSDGDGIFDYNDPWPNFYGPFVDMNLNGKIDPLIDVQVRHFGEHSFFWLDYYNHVSVNPFFWDNYYFYRDFNYHNFYFHNKEINNNYRKREGGTTVNTGVKLKDKPSVPTRRRNDYVMPPYPTNRNRESGSNPKIRTRDAKIYTNPTRDRNVNQSIQRKRENTGTSNSTLRTRESNSTRTTNRGTNTNSSTRRR